MIESVNDVRVLVLFLDKFCPADENHDVCLFIWAWSTRGTAVVATPDVALLIALVSRSPSVVASGYTHARSRAGPFFFTST